MLKLTFYAWAKTEPRLTWLFDQQQSVPAISLIPFKAFLKFCVELFVNNIGYVVTLYFTTYKYEEQFFFFFFTHYKREGLYDLD